VHRHIANRARRHRKRGQRPTGVKVIVFQSMT